MILEVDEIKLKVNQLIMRLGHQDGPISIVQSFLDLQRDFWIGLTIKKQYTLAYCHAEICEKVVKLENEPWFEKLIYYPEDGTWEWLPVLLLNLIMVKVLFEPKY